jgi:hypothetical protein
MPALTPSFHNGRLNVPSLRKRAKRLLKSLNADHADEARQQLIALGLPGPAYHLADTQWLVAREAGFASWPKLIAHAEAVAFAARHPGFSSSDEANVQHWRCGNDIEHTLRRVGLTGPFHMFDDPVVMGPVPAASEQDYWAARAAYIQRAFGLKARDVEQRQALQRAALAQLGEHSELVLWCEGDAYDQLFLVRLLASLPTLPRRLELIETHRVPGVERFIGIGQLAPDVLAWLWPQRRALKAEALVLAREAWAAYTAPDPTAWAGLAACAHPALPLLAPALARQLQELPGEADGLSLTERLVLRILSDHGELLAGEVFQQLMMRYDPLPTLGDAMFHVLLQPMIHAPCPLIVEGAGAQWPQRTLRMTAMGERVLRGEANWLDHTPPDRWVGGVHLTAQGATWVVSPSGQVAQRRR